MVASPHIDHECLFFPLFTLSISPFLGLRDLSIVAAELQSTQYNTKFFHLK